MTPCCWVTLWQKIKKTKNKLVICLSTKNIQLSIYMAQGWQSLILLLHQRQQIPISDFWGTLCLHPHPQFIGGRFVPIDGHGLLSPHHERVSADEMFLPRLFHKEIRGVAHRSRLRMTQILLSSLDILQFNHIECTLGADGSNRDGARDWDRVLHCWMSWNSWWCWFLEHYHEMVLWWIDQ